MISPFKLGAKYTLLTCPTLTPLIKIGPEGSSPSTFLYTAKRTFSLENISTFFKKLNPHTSMMMARIKRIPIENSFEIFKVQTLGETNIVNF
jgi:hypothetical protein